MENDELDELFSALSPEVVRPKAGHRDRFRIKLEKAVGKNDDKSKVFKLWPSIIGLAAALLVALLLIPGLLFSGQPQKRELASVSQEMKNTQNFYTASIQRELQSLKGVKSSENQRMIQDALGQLETLERDYESLKTDLVNSGNDKRVVYAMISNFQKRMDLLNKLIEKAQNLNHYNSMSHENDYL